MYLQFNFKKYCYFRVYSLIILQLLDYVATLDTWQSQLQLLLQLSITISLTKLFHLHCVLFHRCKKHLRTYDCCCAFFIFGNFNYAELFQNFICHSDLYIHYDYIYNILFQLLMNQGNQQARKEDPPTEAENSKGTESGSATNQNKQSVLSRARKIVEALKKCGKSQVQDISFKELNFPIRNTKSNFCARQINLQDEYYVCEDCGGSICLSCFQAEKHQGHKYSVRQCNEAWKKCGCGYEERLKKQAHCSKHQNCDVEIECQINQEQRKQFIECFVYLFTQAQKSSYKFYSVDSIYLDFVSKLTGYLIYLNHNSVYYNRLTFELAMRTIEPQQMQNSNNDNNNNNNKKILIFSFFPGKFYNNQLVVQMGGDLRTRMQIIKFIFLQYVNGSSAVPYQLISDIVNAACMSKLLDQGYFNATLEQCHQKLPHESQIYRQIHNKVIGFKLRSANTFSQLENINIKKTSLEIYYEMLKKTLEMFPSSDKIRGFIKCKQSSEENPWANYQQCPDKQEKCQNLPEDVIKGIKVFFKTIEAALIEVQNPLDILKQLEIRKINAEKLSNIMEWAVKYYASKQTDQNQRIIIVLLLLIRQMPNKEHLLQRLWEQILQRQDQKKGKNFSNLVDNFYYYLCLLLHADFWAYSIKKGLAEDLLIAKEEMNQVLINYLASWLRDFLSVRKVTTKQMLKLKKKGLLQFKQVGKIIKELCNFEQIGRNQTCFHYKGPKVFNNANRYFSVIPTADNLPQIYNCKISFGDKIELLEGSLAKVLIQEFLSCKGLTQVIHRKWEEYKSEKQKQLTEKLGYLYLFYLVAFDAFANGENKEIREQLTKIRDNEQLMKEYYNDEEEKAMVKRLLGIQKEQMEENQVKKNQVVQNAKSESLQNQQQPQTNYSQQCALCHKKAKPDNQLFFICCLNKKTASKAFHGENNATNTHISTCFHGLHFNCFEGIKKFPDLSFDCPTCNTESNCILPIRYNDQLNKICNKILNVVKKMKYKSLKPEETFIILFKHLVQSNSLGCALFVQIQKHKDRVQAKNDQFIEKLVIQILQSAQKKQKEAYLEQINQLAQEILKCPKQEFQCVQLLFVQALKQSLGLVQEDTPIIQKHLHKVKETLQKKEYILLKENLESILKRHVEQPALNPEQSQTKKASLAFKLSYIPKNAADFFQMFKNKKCEKCFDKQAYFFCLISGKMFCNSCGHKVKSQFQQQQNCMIILINPYIMTVPAKTRDMQSYHNIYFNNIKLNYQGYHSYFPNDQFLLDEDALHQFVNLFLRINRHNKNKL